MTVKKIEKEIREQIPDEDKILKKYINTNSGEGYVEIEVIYEVLETIGVEDKIIF